MDPIRLSETEQQDSIMALFYGHAGTGKTEIGGTTGDKGLIINISKGIATLQSPGFKQRHPDCNPQILTIYDKGNLFDDVCDAIDYNLEKNYDTFDTIVIDDFSSLKKAAMSKGLEVSRFQLGSNSLEILKKQGVVIPNVMDYNAEMVILEKFIATYKEIFAQAKKHMILIAHVRETFRKGDKIGDLPLLVKVRPSFTGATFPDQMLQYFDLVGYCSVTSSGEKKKYVVDFTGSSVIAAKNRFSGLIPAEKVTNFNWREFVSKLKESQNASV